MFGHGLNRGLGCDVVFVVEFEKKRVIKVEFDLLQTFERGVRQTLIAHADMRVVRRWERKEDWKNHGTTSPGKAVAVYLKG